MERYKIEFSKKAAKIYKKIPVSYKTLIDLSLYNLSSGIPVDLKPLKGEESIYRIRVGKYRVLFVIIDRTIVITRIGPRGDVYK